MFNGFKCQIKYEISTELYNLFPVMMLNVMVKESTTLCSRCQLSLFQEAGSLPRALGHHMQGK